MSTYTLADFDLDLRRARSAHPDWRYGQAVFNVAASTRATAARAESMRGTDRDPFYRSSRAPSFVLALFDEEAS